MYWNDNNNAKAVIKSALNSNIRCIEIWSSRCWKIKTIWLNSNIRCIEMMERKFPKFIFASWIVTLDVLKYCSKCGKHNELCSWIVTLDVLKWRRIPFYDSLDLLNSNIRCIEMGNNDAAILASRGWIVTLDVLKYVITSSITGINALNSNIRCIEIRLITAPVIFPSLLNSNIRCIEITL